MNTKDAIISAIITLLATQTVIENLSTISEIMDTLNDYLFSENDDITQSFGHMYIQVSVEELLRPWLYARSFTTRKPVYETENDDTES